MPATIEEMRQAIIDIFSFNPREILNPAEPLLEPKEIGVDFENGTIFIRDGAGNYKQVTGDSPGTAALLQKFDIDKNLLTADIIGSTLVYDSWAQLGVPAPINLANIYTLMANNSFISTVVAVGDDMNDLVPDSLGGLLYIYKYGNYLYMKYHNNGNSEYRATYNTVGPVYNPWTAAGGAGVTVFPGHFTATVDATVLVPLTDFDPTLDKILVFHSTYGLVKPESYTIAPTGASLTLDVSNELLKDERVDYMIFKKTFDSTTFPIDTINTAVVNKFNTDLPAMLSSQLDAQLPSKLTSYIKRSSGVQTYYVSTVGSNSNDGLTAGTPFLTIQKALDVASGARFLEHDVTINVANGIYAEDLIIKGLLGTNTLTLSGAAVVDGSRRFNSITISRCVASVKIIGFRATSTTQDGFANKGSINVEIDQCDCISAGGTVADGASTINGTSKITNCWFSSRNNAISAGVGGRVFTDVITGSGNLYGLLAKNGGNISFIEANMSLSGTAARYYCDAGGTLTREDGTAMGQIKAASVQSTALSLFVDPTGNDVNKGLGSGTSAFKTLQAAVNSLPKRLDVDVLIYVAAGTYAENLKINGFDGSGSLTLQGDSVASTSRSVTDIRLTGNTAKIKIQGMNITSTTTSGIIVDRCASVEFSYMNIVGVTGSYDGIRNSDGNVLVSNSVISSHVNALYSSVNSRLTSQNNTGTGNTYGLTVNSGGIISKTGTQPNGNTSKERAVSGGIILASDGTFAGPVRGMQVVTAATTLYVRTDGSDTNDGSTDTAGGAYRTLQKAIDSLPKRIDYGVTINVGAGTYTEDVTIAGFTGSSTLSIIGDMVVSTSRTVYSLNIVGNTAGISIRGLNLTTTTKDAISILNSVYVYMNCMNMIAATASWSGLMSGYSLTILVNSVISNKTHSNGAICSSTGSRVIAQVVSGVGNTFGLVALSGGIIHKHDITLAATTPEYTSSAGLIVNTDGTFGGSVRGAQIQSTALDLYVDATAGSDSNPGTNALPLKTIMAAINRLPKRLDAVVTIYVASGSYSETVTVEGFTGSGVVLRILGSSSIDTTRNVLSLVIRNNTLPIYIQGLNITTTAGIGVACSNCINVQLSYMNNIGSKSYEAYLFIACMGLMSHCVGSNSWYGVRGYSMSNISLIDVTGSGNTIGIGVDSGATVALGSLTTITGTTKASQTEGGSIIPETGLPTIYKSTAAPISTDGKDGDVWIKYKV